MSFPPGGLIRIYDANGEHLFYTLNGEHLFYTLTGSFTGVGFWWFLWWAAVSDGILGRDY